MAVQTFLDCNTSSVQDAAEFYASQGLQPVKILPKQKKPFETEWQKKDYGTPEKAFAAFAGHKGNIGIRGDDKGNTAIDFDNKDFANAMLCEMPELHDTLQSGGKKGDPMGHYLIQADVPFKEKSIIKMGPKDADGARSKETYADIRSLGGQIVVAPSIHPEGMQYKWRNNNPILRVKTSRLMLAIANVCDAMDVKNPYEETVANRAVDRSIFRLVKERVKLSDVAGTTAAMIDCIIHKEITPSKALKLYHKTNSWYCHSCHGGGDVIGLYAELHGLTMLNAALALAKKFNIEIPDSVRSYSGKFDLTSVLKEITQPDRFGSGVKNGKPYFGIQIMVNEREDKVGKDGSKRSIEVERIKPFVVMGSQSYVAPDAMKKYGFDFPRDFGSVEVNWDRKKIFPYLKNGEKAKSTKEILERLIALNKKTVWQHSEDSHMIVSAYTMAAYMFQAFEQMPRIVFIGLAGSGKSVQTDVMAAVGLNPITSADCSKSFVFRSVENTGGLVCVDNFDNLNEDVQKDFVQLFDTSFEQGRGAGRTEDTGRAKIPRKFRTYCPMIVNCTSLAWMRQQSSKSRTIFIRMETKNNIELQRLKDISKEELAEIRHDLRVWSLERWQALSEYTVDAAIFTNREGDIFRPILAVLNEAGSDYHTKGIEYLKAMADEFQRDELDAFEGELISAIWAVATRTKEATFTTTPKDLATVILYQRGIREYDGQFPNKAYQTELTTLFSNTIPNSMKSIPTIKITRPHGKKTFALSKPDFVRFCMARAIDLDGMRNWSQNTL